MRTRLELVNKRLLIAPVSSDAPIQFQGSHILSVQTNGPRQGVVVTFADAIAIIQHLKQAFNITDEELK